ncbi:hypothetical protein [Bacillus sp. 1P02SD]|uniref:hypothetical protein n=1 Tax=Bacillus sp. 1P02SD TaxID=3132264 RepID=UPI0039A00832
MQIKGIFNQRGTKDSENNELNRLNLRMNALEVQLKKLLDFEKELRLSRYNFKEKPLSSNDKKRDTVLDLMPLIEKVILEKMAVYQQREKKLQTKIQQLESQMAVLVKRDNETPTQSEGQKTEIAQRDSLLLDSLESRLLLLEQNFEMVYEEQKILVKQVEEHQQQNNGCSENQKDVDDSTESPFQTVYIDKLYVDKYEQNNNFAQLGINSLSGSLNIGATYGSAPQKINEQIKKDFEKIKAAKEEMQNPKSEEEFNDQSHEESSSESENPQQETYTEIEIEED